MEEVTEPYESMDGYGTSYKHGRLQSVDKDEWHSPAACGSTERSLLPL